MIIKIYIVSGNKKRKDKNLPFFYLQLNRNYLTASLSLAPTLNFATVDSAI